MKTVYIWRVFSKSGVLLDEIEAYSKKDAEALADNSFGDMYKPLTVVLVGEKDGNH